MKRLAGLEINRELRAYGIDASPRVCDQIQTYIDLLLLWNKKLSLTTHVDPSEILRFHFGESAFGLKSMPTAKGRLGDIGSGAGFPGLPIALLCPDLEVSLIESNGKKSAFLSEVVSRLDV